MPIIDVTSGLTGPLPWIASAPLVVRITVFLASLGAGVVAVVVTDRRAKGER